MNAILIFGASGAFGIGVDPKLGWVGRLKSDFEPKEKYNAVYNLGVPGETSSDLLKRFDIEAKARIKKRWPKDKYAIVFSIGTNDSASREKDGEPTNNIDTLSRNMRELVSKAKEYTDRVLVMGLWPVDEERVQPYEAYYFLNERIKKYHEAIKAVCQELSVPFLDKFEEVYNSDYKPLLLDGIHGTEEGYQRLYELVKNWLEENKIIQ